jgi:SPP1 family predicted phage head-tail adaptor
LASCTYLPATFRKRLTIQEVTKSSDGQGGFTDQWNDLQDVSASVEPLKAYERFQAMQMQTPITHKIVMRYHPTLTTTARLRLGDRVFTVKEIINVEERNAYLVIKAIERAGATGSPSNGILLEDGTRLLAEDGTGINFEQPGGIVPAANPVGLEDGTSLLNEDGTKITLEL